MRGTVEKIIKSSNPSEPEKAEIALHEAEHLYREIRVENELTDDTGQKSSLKPGANVDVIVEADSDATMKSHQWGSRKQTVSAQKTGSRCKRYHHGVR